MKEAKTTLINQWSELKKHVLSSPQDTIDLFNEFVMQHQAFFEAGILEPISSKALLSQHPLILEWNTLTEKTIHSPTPEGFRAIDRFERENSVFFEKGILEPFSFNDLYHLHFPKMYYVGWSFTQKLTTADEWERFFFSLCKLAYESPDRPVDDTRRKIFFAMKTDDVEALQQMIKNNIFTKEYLDRNIGDDLENLTLRYYMLQRANQNVLNLVFNAFYQGDWQQAFALHQPIETIRQCWLMQNLPVTYETIIAICESANEEWLNDNFDKVRLDYKQLVECLKVASKNNQIPIVDYLLNKLNSLKMNLDARDYERVVGIAFDNRNIELVRILFKLGLGERYNSSDYLNAALKHVCEADYMAAATARDLRVVGADPGAIKAFSQNFDLSQINFFLEIGANRETILALPQGKEILAALDREFEHGVPRIRKKRVESMPKDLEHHSRAENILEEFKILPITPDNIGTVSLAEFHNWEFKLLLLEAMRNPNADHVQAVEEYIAKNGEKNQVLQDMYKACKPYLRPLMQRLPADVQRLVFWHVPQRARIATMQTSKMFEKEFKAVDEARYAYMYPKSYKKIIEEINQGKRETIDWAAELREAKEAAYQSVDGVTKALFIAVRDPARDIGLVKKAIEAIERLSSPLGLLKVDALENIDVMQCAWLNGFDEALREMFNRLIIGHYSNENLFLSAINAFQPLDVIQSYFNVMDSNKALEYSTACETGFQDACERNRLDVVKFLLEQEAIQSHKLRDDEKGATYLRVACDKSSFDVAWYLIGEGAPLKVIFKNQELMAKLLTITFSERDEKAQQWAREMLAKNILRNYVAQYRDSEAPEEIAIRKAFKALHDAIADPSESHFAILAKEEIQSVLMSERFIEIYGFCQPFLDSKEPRQEERERPDSSPSSPGQ